MLALRTGETVETRPLDTLVAHAHDLIRTA
jgi:hypothetical protein